MNNSEKGIETMKSQEITSLQQLNPHRQYSVYELMSLLKNLNLLHSIYTIRDYETWKCLDYKCGKRHNSKVNRCSKCSGSVRKPLIPSPRTLGGGTGPGHRRYTAKEIKEIVDIFSRRH